MKKILCRLFGHREFSCVRCKYAAIAIFVAGLRASDRCDDDRHGTCSRCGAFRTQDVAGRPVWQDVDP